MKAPKTLKLMMLSSTMRTLIGGTELSNKPAGKLGGSTGFGFLRFFSGRGEATRGVGGVEVWRTDSTGTGGVGTGAFVVAECFDSDAEES